MEAVKLANGGVMMLLDEQEAKYLTAVHGAMRSHEAASEALKCKYTTIHPKDGGSWLFGFYVAIDSVVNKNQQSASHPSAKLVEVEEREEV